MITHRSNQKYCLAVAASPQDTNQHLLEIGLVGVEEGEKAADEHCSSPAKPLPELPGTGRTQTSKYSKSESSGKSEGLLTASAQVCPVMTTVSWTSLVPRRGRKVSRGYDFSIG